MKSWRFTEKSIPAVIALLTALAYGLLLPFTGFYWDDWPFAWIARFLGPKEFFRAFAGVRPFLEPIFFVTTSLVPPIPLYWQIFALIIRFFSGLSAWFAFKELWPHSRRQALVTSLLFLLFPGYSQYWVAFTHINQEWIPFLFYILSFGFTTRALRHSTRFMSNTLYAILFLIVGVFPTEYFLGLEPLRCFFIWMILSETSSSFQQRMIQSLKQWSPYLLVWLANAAWLAYFYTIGTYDSYDVEVIKQPLTIFQIILDFGEAIWKGGFYIWSQILVLIAKSPATPVSILTLLLIAVIFLGSAFYLSRLDEREEAGKSFAGTTILAGLSGLLLGRLPSLAAGLPLTLQSSNDRFMISMMLAGSVFIVGLVEFATRNRRIKIYIFALLIALSLGQQFFNANIFRRDWERQQEFFWELAWRIPALKPNTLIITDMIPVDYETDISFTAPINWIYAPDYRRSNLPYAILYTDIRLGGTSLPALEKSINIDMGLRTVYFHGSTSQAIVIYVPKNGCLRVLDPARGDQVTYEKHPIQLRDAIPLSDITNILVDHDRARMISFLAEPSHSWCYFYEKAELAYQKKDWPQVIKPIDEAISLGYQPDDPFEWLGYVEAQAWSGNIEIAKMVSRKAFAEDEGIRKGLCEVWRRVQVEGPVRSESSRKIVSQILKEYQCR